MSDKPLAEPIPDDVPLPRSGPFGIVPREIAEDWSLPGGAVRTYIALACFANKSRKAWPAINTLAKVVGSDGRNVKAASNRRNVQRWLRMLKMCGHIEIERYMRPTGGWGSNIYTLLRPDAVVDVASPPDDAVVDVATHMVVDVTPDAVVDVTPEVVPAVALTDHRTDQGTEISNSSTEHRLSFHESRDFTPLTDPEEEEHRDTASPKEERVPMSVALAPGTTTWAEHKAKMRAAKEKAKEAVDAAD